MNVHSHTSDTDDSSFEAARNVGTPVSRGWLTWARAGRWSLSGLSGYSLGYLALRVATLSVICLVVGVLFWRATLPNNQHRNLDVYGTREGGLKLIRSTDGYDDAATIVTAYHFAHDGFLASHFLPNRGRAPQVSVFDFSETQCETTNPPDHPLRYANPYGRWIDMISLTDQCIYAHYPPLADWFYGALATVGLGEILYYRVAAILLNVAFLVSVFWWARGEVRESAAWATVLVTATLPAFFQWGDSLFFHSFQYLFLFAGVIAWRAHLRQPRMGRLLATWGLFFGQALLSYDFIVFFALVVLVLSFLECPQLSWRVRLRDVAVVASAPVSAVALHFGLRISLFGLAETLSNAQLTLHSRIVDGISWFNIQLFERHIRSGLLGLELLVACALLIVVIRALCTLDLKRPLVMLGLFFVGALSYTLVFPGTSLSQPWMKYRHFMPLTVVILAYTSDALFYAGPALREQWGALGASRKHWLLLAAAIASAGVLTSVVVVNLRTLKNDVAWRVASNVHHDPKNLATHFLDVVHWFETPWRAWDDRLHMPFDGRRVNDPPYPGTRFNVQPGMRAHLEIWWLEDTPLRTIRVLTERALVQPLLDDCRLTYFDGSNFLSAPRASSPRVSDFVPAPGEPPAAGYTWVDYQLDAPVRSRALRFSFDGRARIPIHEIEVFAE